MTTPSCSSVSSPFFSDPNRLLRLKDVLELVPVAASTWWSWVAHGTAPAPTHLGRCTFWRYRDILQFTESGTLRDTDASQV